jgi:hypothetical protein
MKLYKSANTITVSRFFKIIETDEYRYLIINYDDENDEVILTDDQTNELKDIFEDIYFEYCELTHNHKLKATMKKQYLIAEWGMIYNLITSCLNLYKDHKEINCLLIINELKEKSYIIDEKLPIEPQVTSLIKKMKALKNKIKIFKIKMVNQVKDDKEEVKFDLDKQAIYLESNLELKREIDPETTTLSKWVKMIQISKEKSLRYGKNTN